MANVFKNIIKSAVLNIEAALLLIAKTFKIDIKFLKFLIVGAVNTLFAYSIYSLFVFVGLKPNSALFFQYIIGVLWNFKTTGVLVFKNNNNKLIFKFIISYVFTFAINSILLKILTNILNDYLAQFVLILPIAIVSFLIFKFWVFKGK